MKKIAIGTRKSKLALIQTEIVKNKIQKHFPELDVEIVKIDTRGDQNLKASLASFGGKGVFTKELEDALLSGRIDLAVHSAKDLPMEFPKGLAICAVPEKADCRDVIVTTSGTPLKELPAGSILGTSSLRRELQAKAINPEIKVKVLRGNVQTRLSKLKNGEYDAIVMAAAGIIRAGLDHEEGVFYEYMDPDIYLPAAGQGILAVEGRKGDLQDLMHVLHDADAAACLMAERQFLKQIGGSCNAPAAVHSYLLHDRLYMKTMFAKDGKTPEYYEISGNKNDAAIIGERAGKSYE